MITEGNSKLGKLISGWSIPALLTCPGASAVCQLLCYALTGFFRMPNVAAAHDRNWQSTKTKEFVPWMIQQIKIGFMRVVRVHVSGDFYDRRYIRRWLKIVRSCPNTKFYAYTRSWTKKSMLELLVELGREPNFVLYFSWDRSMPFPPKRKGIRTCYLSENDGDLPRRMTDLVFRDDPATPMKHDHKGNLVCPYDNGVTKITCSSCKICWTKEAHYGTSNLRYRRNSARGRYANGHAVVDTTTSNKSGRLGRRGDRRAVCQTAR